MSREKKGQEFPTHSGRSPVERHVQRSGAMRPRITLPNFPRPFALEEAAPEDDILLPNEEALEDDEPTDPKLIPGSGAIQIKIPR